MKSTRGYRMTTRRQAVDATRRRILVAVRDLAYDDLDFEPTLDAVADRAGVSVQTVLRHFDTRQALLAAAVDAATADIVAERRPPAPDVDTALATLLEHYELRGDFVLAMLARERTSPPIAALADRGKREHRDWVETVFAAALPASPPARDALVDQLVVATDVYAWKLLRRDRGHDVPTVIARMRAMTDALTAHPQREEAAACRPHSS